MYNISVEENIKRAKFFAKLLDSQFEICGVRFGLDPIINLIPWLGDVIGMILSLYILNMAKEMGVSRVDLFKMIGNIIIDFVVGFIPFLGVIFDVAYKANTKNVRILEKYRGKMRIKGKVVEGDIIS